MADTLVQRVTGRPAETPEPVAVNLVLTDATLLGGDTTAAVVDGYGPIPAAVARGWSTPRSPTSGRGHPAAVVSPPEQRGVGGDGVTVTLFPRGLAAFIGLRDQRCRTRYCDAPIRHRDHAQPRNRGGPTSATNGLGACERCNYAKEAPGWQVRAGDENGVHTAEFVTPTVSTTTPPRRPCRARWRCWSARSKPASASPSPVCTPPNSTADAPRGSAAPGGPHRTATGAQVLRCSGSARGSDAR